VGRLGRHESGCALAKQLASTDYSDWNEHNRLDRSIHIYIGPQGSHGLYMGLWRMAYKEAESRWTPTSEVPEIRQAEEERPSGVEEVVGQHGRYWAAFTFECAAQGPGESCR
jgi:hypothetical protein